MTTGDLNATTTTDFKNAVGNFSISPKTTDAGYAQKEFFWSNKNADKYYGYYYNVGEFRSAIKSYAIHVLGWGYDCPLTSDQAILENINGNGKETFWSLIYNHLHAKKFEGDAYLQIIRNDEGTLINLKTLDPRKVTHVLDDNGIIIGYDYWRGKDMEPKRLKPNEVLHSMNNRILDEPHGTPETSAVEWVIEAVQEAERDWRRIMHYSSVRILYVDETDTTRLNKLKTDLAEGIKTGNVLILTVKPEEAKFQDLTVPPADAFVRYLNYLEGKFYSQLGISKVAIGGTTENNTEASAKVNMVITEPVWIKEITELQDDLWNQLGIEIKIRKQPSMMDNLQVDETKNTGQTMMKPIGSGQ